MVNGRPNDERGILHRKILKLGSGLITSLIPGGSVARDVVGAGLTLVGGGGGKGPAIPGVPGVAPMPLRIRAGGGRIADFIRANFASMSQAAIAAITGITPQAVQDLAARLGLLGAAPGNGNGAVSCEPPLVPDPRGEGFCVFPGGPSFGQGELVAGRYGPAEEPFFETRNIRSCLRGFILGDDKLCYKKGTISNKERLYPAPRRPLLTGGELNAIRTASRAANKFKLQQKRLESLGFMKKPARRARQVPAFHRATVEHND